MASMLDFMVPGLGSAAETFLGSMQRAPAEAARKAAERLAVQPPPPPPPPPGRPRIIIEKPAIPPAAIYGGLVVGAGLGLLALLRK